MKNFESTIQSRLEYLEEFTRHLTCNVSTTPFVPGGATNGRAVCDVSAAWMASSLENAMKRIPDSSVTVPGFRAGKAPLELMRRRKAGQAHQLMMDWVLQDITEVLDAHVDFQLLSEVTLEVSEPWTSGKRLTVEAAFFACPYPAITLDEIVSAIAAKGLREGIWLGFDIEAFLWLERALSDVITSDLSDDLRLEIIRVNQGKSSEVEGEYQPEEWDGARVSFSLLFLTKRLIITPTESEFEAALAEIALKEGQSVLDIHNQLIEEAGVESFWFHLRVQKALSEIAGRIRPLIDSRR